jgi:hypothetical protein
LSQAHRVIVIFALPLRGVERFDGGGVVVETRQRCSLIHEVFEKKPILLRRMGPEVAPLRHAECVERCPSLRAKRKNICSH